ncbi:MAG TPA: terminase large subunit, partial [Epulopiscium sp.]|nr:terminase large subunit [Candidatus Epulonipiscium sp.]
PEYITQWFLEKAKEYHILDIVADDFRVSVLEEDFKKKGLPLHKTRSGPVTHGKLAPMIEVMFADEKVAFGDNPTMRWYINNTYQQLDAKGNVTYLKIEPKTRKTDGFFAFIHALTKDGELKEQNTVFRKLTVRTY